MLTSLRMLSNGNQLFIGIAVGIFLGLCISLFNDDYFLTVNIHSTDPFFNILPIHLLTQKNKQQQTPTFRCIILLNSGKGQKPEKEFSAILDTWGSDCNELLFFTDSSSLQQRYADELNISSRILLVQGHNSFNVNEWPLIQYIFHYVENNSIVDENNIERRWTIISDGKSYVHTKNLRDLLERIDVSVPLIIGSKHSKINLLHSIFSKLFPFVGISSTDWPVSATISTDTPIIISYRAFNTISKLCGKQQSNYVSSWWEKIISIYKINSKGIPKHSGRVFGGCALQMGIALFDPLDEESRPLIVKHNLRAIFSKSEQIQTKKSQKQMISTLINSTILQVSECCSDRAIAFGLLNHKDQRLLDFGVRRLKVFGRE